MILLTVRDVLMLIIRNLTFSYVQARKLKFSVYVQELNISFQLKIDCDSESPYIILALVCKHLY